MGPQQLRRIFDPKSIAVVGASEDSGKFGNWILRAIIENRYGGSVYPINPNASSILGMKAYPSIDKIPRRQLDLAIVATPARLAPAIVRELKDKQTKGAVVIASGFSEAGKEGEVLQEHLLDEARNANVRIIGPNTMGFVNTSNNLVASFGRAIISRRHRKGTVALITQSGAFGQALLIWGEDQGIGFSKFINTGNEADLTCSHYLEYLASDPQTKLILMYIEGLKDARGFLTIAKKTTPHKPVVAVKVGRTEAGAKAAQSHTGSLAGSDRLYDAAFKQSGVLRADGPEEMFDIARAFQRQALPRGKGVGILTSSGGLGVETADACQMLGLDVPRLSSPARRYLKSFLSGFAALNNPIDLTSDVHLNPWWWKEGTRTLLDEKNVHALIIAVSAITDVRVAKIIADATKNTNKTVIATWIIGEMARSAISYLEKSGVPVYPTPERAAHVVAALWRYSQHKYARIGIRRACT